ncbi:MAG: OmpA family protein [Candidatus Tectomicrobia bacterium]|uniref:OmpA family protein n=1 Tax=Tectimicrobiota bacterium TaxID=2528274 RepID=A0A933GJX1_UNCTE|nr:OmpA family protein [Candidatus Tectomicrobia bacterium]
MQSKEGKRYFGFLFFFILLIAFLGFNMILGCGVSRDVYRIKSQESNQFQEDLQMEKKKLLDAERKISEQSAKIEALSRENEEFKGRNQELTSLLDKKAATQGKMVEDLLEKNQALAGDLNMYKLKAEERDQKVRELTETVKRLEAKKEKDVQEVRSVYDSLLEQLQDEVKKGEIQIRQLADRLSINVVEKIFFDTGKAEIKPSGLQVLAKLGGVLKGVKEKKILVEGHTDNVTISGQLTRKFPTNWELSSARATAVVRFLIEKMGIDGSQLSAAAFSQYQPIASNETPEGKSLNRRIEIVLK